MSGSAFDIEEDEDFEAMFNSSLSVAESQEGDTNVPEESEVLHSASTPEGTPPAPAQSADEPEPQVSAEDTGQVEETVDDESRVETENIEDDETVDTEDYVLSADEHEEEAEEEAYEADDVNYVDDAPSVAAESEYDDSRSEQTSDERAEDERDEYEEQEDHVEDEFAEEEVPVSAPQTVIKEGVDTAVSLETLDASFAVLDAYRSMEEDEKDFAAAFMGLEDGSGDAEVVSFVLNADPLLTEVFNAIEEAFELDDTEIAFYIVGLGVPVLDGITFVAAQYLEEDPVKYQRKQKIQYARGVVQQVKRLDDRALRLVSAANALVRGEARSDDLLNG